MEGRDVISAALTLRSAHPKLSARTTLDMAVGTCPAATLPVSAWAADTKMPRSPFGQLLAEAFDTEMSATEWAVYTGPDADAELRALIQQRWRDRVIDGLSRRYLARPGERIGASST